MAHHLNGHQVKTPATALVTVLPPTLATKQSPHPVEHLRVSDAGGEFPSHGQKSLFTALSPSVTTGADQASCKPSETPLGVTGAFTADALFCLILGNAYCLLAAVKIFSITFVILKLCYAYINWLDRTVDLYIYVGERSKNKEVVSKACNETSLFYISKSNVFLCP